MSFLSFMSVRSELNKKILTPSYISDIVQIERDLYLTSTIYKCQFCLAMIQKLVVCLLGGRYS